MNKPVDYPTGTLTLNCMNGVYADAPYNLFPFSFFCTIIHRIYLSLGLGGDRDQKI